MQDPKLCSAFFPSPAKPANPSRAEAPASRHGRQLPRPCQLLSKKKFQVSGVEGSRPPEFRVQNQRFWGCRSVEQSKPYGNHQGMVYMLCQDCKRVCKGTRNECLRRKGYGSLQRTRELSERLSSGVVKITQGLFITSSKGVRELSPNLLIKVNRPLPCVRMIIAILVSRPLERGGSLITTLHYLFVKVPNITNPKPCPQHALHS